MHYDGCDITWQAMLTRLDEYEGGGTYFRCLRKTVKLRQGQVLVHPGEEGRGPSERRTAAAPRTPNRSI